MELVTTIGFSPGSTQAVSRDQIVVSPPLGLLAVADAASGGADGRAGAKLALDLVRSHIERNADVLQRFRRAASSPQAEASTTQELRLSVIATIEEAFTRAAQEIFAFARRKSNVVVMLDVLLLLETEAFIGHVGDGRIYLVRRGLVHQLTVDHSRGDEILQFGQADAQGGGAAALYGLGPTPRVRLESMCTELAPEDRFVLCAAGLQTAVPETILHTRFISEHLANLGAALASDAGIHPLLSAAAQIGSGEPFTPDSAAARLAILGPMSLFMHCTERELRIVASATTPRTFPANTFLFEENQPGDELFLVISGSVDVIKNELGVEGTAPQSEGDRGGGEQDRDQALETDRHFATTGCETTRSTIVMRRFFARASRMTCFSCSVSVPSTGGTVTCGVLSACVQITM